MFDEDIFDSAIFDTGVTVPVTVILAPPIWASVVMDGDGWTLSIHGRGDFWTPQADTSTNWS